MLKTAKSYDFQKNLWKNYPFRRLDGIVTKLPDGDWFCWHAAAPTLTLRQILKQA